MKRNSSVLILFVFFSLCSFAQVGINPTGSAPHSSAGLDIDFSDKGFLIPRMTQAQRDAIQQPAMGLQVYNTDTDCVNMWTGDTWKQSCYDCDFTLPAVSSNSPLCEGNDLNLFASSLNGATYSWSGPNAFVSDEQNPVIFSPTSAASGLYTLIVTVNGCSSAPIGVNVTVSAIPIAPTASSNSPLCAGATLNLSAGNVVGASYVWSGPNGFYSTQQNPSQLNVTIGNAGTYEVSATVNGCTSAPTSNSVIVSNVPPAPGPVVGETSFCAYSTGKVYSVSSVAGATSYVWSVPSGASIVSGQGTLSATVDFGSTGGSVCVTADNTCGSSSPACTSISLQGGGGGTQTFSYTGGIQNWTVPACVTQITIEAWGAEGGTNQTVDRFGGKGARMKGTFSVTSGQQLRILVGQKGLNGTINQYAAGSGGGGTAVSVVGDSTPMIVAGGGGGAGGRQGTYHNGGDGLSSTNGGGAYPNGSSSGGSNGSGGFGGVGHEHCGASGGGWYSGGTSSVSQSNPGAALNGSAAGGISGGSYGPNGGYGGGGAANVAGGGGGGYSGGAGGDQLSGWIEYGGGGGGSFNTGSAQDNASGVKSGDGQVIITW
ncbi:MAG: hypothetical protein IT223_10090 [Crocinitomicaceae bacterium]|nr:hypothetical protein [Crocinitomicaceae bacterium]